MTKQKESSVAKLVERLHRRAASEPIDFEQFFNRIADSQRASSVFTGTFWPASIPQTTDRYQMRKEFAEEFAKEDHDDLAQMAAALLEGGSLWRSLFKEYAEFEIQRRRIEQTDLFTRIRELESEVSSALTDGSMRGYLSSQVQLARSPKQNAKRDVFHLWQERREGKHPKLGTNEQFAIECTRRWPVLKNLGTILGWCTAWNKEATRKSQPAS